MAAAAAGNNRIIRRWRRGAGAFHVIGDERDKVLAYQCVAAAQPARRHRGRRRRWAHAEGIKKMDRICARGWPVLPQHYYLQPRGFARVPESKRALFRQEDEAAINALYDIEQPRQQIIGFCTKALAVDLAAAAAAAGCWRLAKRRGGLFFERTKMLFKAAAASSFLGSLAALSITNIATTVFGAARAKARDMGEKRSPSPLVAAVVCSCAIPRLSLSLFLFLLCLILVQSTEEGGGGGRGSTPRGQRQRGPGDRRRESEKRTAGNGSQRTKTKKQQGGESWRDGWLECGVEGRGWNGASGGVRVSL